MMWSCCGAGGFPPKFTVVLILAAVFSLRLASGQEGGTFDPDGATVLQPNDTNCSVASDSPFAECPYPTTCEDEGDSSSHSGKHIGLAFGLTIGAGLSTTLGALFPFIPFVKRSNTIYLAAALALAAGVMLYVSFTEIWEESKLNFCCVTPLHYELAASLCFFGGIILTIALDALVWWLEKIDCGCQCFPPRRKSRDRKSLATDQKSKVLRAVNPLSLFKKTSVRENSRVVLPSTCVEAGSDSSTASSVEMAEPAASVPLDGAVTLPSAGDRVCCCGEGTYMYDSAA